MKYEDVSKTIQERLASRKPLRERLSNGGSRRMQRIWLPLALIAGAILIYIGFVATAPTVTPEEGQERSWTVSSAAIAFEDIA